MLNAILIFLYCAKNNFMNEKIITTKDSHTVSVSSMLLFFLGIILKAKACTMHLIEKIKTSSPLRSLGYLTGIPMLNIIILRG
jgi:hypothetical protein